MGSGFRLRECRIERGFTQQQIAEVLGVSRVAYTHYENGDRDMPTEMIVQLADFYECMVDELLGSNYWKRHRK